MEKLRMPKVYTFGELEIMTAKEAKEILTRELRAEPDEMYLRGLAAGYLHALEGQEVRALIETLEDVEKFLSLNLTPKSATLEKVRYVIAEFKGINLIDEIKDKYFEKPSA